MPNRTLIYLDNAATTPLGGVARAAMEPYFGASFGNASSPYAISRSARAAIDRSRAQVAELIGAHPDEVVFTSGGTESDNWALLGTALARLPDFGHILVSAVEHPAVLESAETLRDLGFEVEHLPVDCDGKVDPGGLSSRLRPNTILISIMSVNNEVGVCQPVGELAAIARGHGVAFHTDAVQSAGKQAVDVARWGVDLLSLSAHKFGGPKGAGALFIRRGHKMRAWQRGGAQERGRRAGTENVPAIVGMGAAAADALAHIAANEAHLLGLRQRLERGLAELPMVTINGRGAPRAPHITNLMVAGQRAESLAMQLDLRGIAVGTGSACASGALEPSHVLAAMGCPPAEAKASLRVSVGVGNTAAEIDEFVDALRRMIERRAEG